MQKYKKPAAKDVALTTCFTALYAVFCIFHLFQIVGLPSKAITMSVVIAPIIGILLGPYLGAVSTFLGGAIGFFVGFLSLPSFVSGIVTAFSAGTLVFKKRSFCIFTYFSFLLFFGFYPFVGPVWLYPLFMWFQILGFLVLISPLQSAALKNIQASNHNSRLLLAFFTICLVATLTGQIAGSLIFEMVSWPILISDINAWATLWQILTWIYPIERIIIALIATFIGVFLYKILMSANLMPFLKLESRKKCLKVKS